MLTRKIPEVAMSVVEEIRRNVKKPQTLPLSLDQRDGSSLRWGRGKGMFFCPMGLHPKSDHNIPMASGDFAGGVCSDEAVKAFFMFWDQQSDAQAAVDAVWGEVKNSVGDECG